ncbi:DoxX-like family protein [Alkalihalobacillus sp. LMS6]|uniref:DoxX-like family protein n=1 Tax=Alkalihalobacillus sp. LMS6 TaxID=2924034 RepID=UPI0020D10AC0|nr:DoxX-like family protein [Alkalihalobacillus sp. LMS6]UTR06130.1 DoxX-like family protein [Alkalihalobacillus sp. LMS6]
MKKSKPIYVETFIKSDLDTVWAYTQEPDLHQKWDLRFSDITYIPKEHPDAAQQFTYQTTIGFGLAIKGTGESVGEHVKENEKQSSLSFWADSPLSLIESGGGYWKYVEHDQGMQFLTQYNYQTKWGALGKGVDLVFKPLMGWATAWSFDTLRLWLEKGIPPTLSFSRSLLFFLCSLVLSLIWIYQGLVPKLLFQDSGELALLTSTGWFQGKESFVLYMLGAGQILFGLSFFLWSHRRILHYVNIVALLGLAIGSLVQTSFIYTAPFNPATLTLAMVALSIIVLINLRDLPFASNCKRKKG